METMLQPVQSTRRGAEVWAWRAFVHYRYHP